MRLLFVLVRAVDKAGIKCVEVGLYGGRRRYIVAVMNGGAFHQMQIEDKRRS